HPDRLPDPRRAGIPDRVRLQLPVLLPAWLGEIGRIVVGTHYQRLRTVRREQVRNVLAERGVAPLVLDRKTTVDPDAGGVIYGPKMKNQPLALPKLRRFKCPAVPAGPEEASESDAARRCFRRERHLNAGIPFDLIRRT